MANELFQYSTADEMQLFQNLIFNKPIGVHKHFAMAVILGAMKSTTRPEVTSIELWSYLEKIYDFNILDAFETIPFPNKEAAFVLPSSILPDVEEDDNESIAGSVEEPEAKVTRLRAHDKLSDLTPKRAPKRQRGTPTSESSSKRRRV